jgi:hypothetical protein
MTSAVVAPEWVSIPRWKSAMAYNTWSEAKDAAIKILGKGADIPEPRGQMLSKINGFERDRNDFTTAYNEFGPKVENFFNQVNAFVTVMEEHQKLVDKSSFGLDPKNRDDAKKIDAAHDLFDNHFFGPAIDEQSSLMNRLDNLSRYWKALRPPK